MKIEGEWYLSFEDQRRWTGFLECELSDGKLVDDGGYEGTYEVHGGEVWLTFPYFFSHTIIFEHTDAFGKNPTAIPEGRCWLVAQFDNQRVSLIKADYWSY